MLSQHWYRKQLGDCRQAISHYLSKCWPISMLLYAVTKPHQLSLICDHYLSALMISYWEQTVLNALNSLRYFTGAAYKFNETNYCNYTESTSEEVDILTDGDLSSCETRRGNAVDLFGLFFKFPMRHVIISVIGSPMICSPVQGLHITIVSTSDQGKPCQAMLSTFPDKCLYRCVCITGDDCSHVVIAVPGVDGGEICEIVVAW